jgi:nucleoside-diphosphate-sugar epimerase
MGRKALVLGASGKVGSRFAHHLLAEGWEVTGEARFSKCETERELRGSGIETIPFEVTRDDPKILPAVDCSGLNLQFVSG